LTDRVQVAGVDVVAAALDDATADERVAFLAVQALDLGLVLSGFAGLVGVTLGIPLLGRALLDALGLGVALRLFRRIIGDRPHRDGDGGVGDRLSDFAPLRPQPRHAGI